jgi:hypothetical protein
MSKGADGRRPSCLTREPHTGTPQIGGMPTRGPSRKTCPVKIPVWVPYTGHCKDAVGSFRSAVLADARDRQQPDRD